MEAIVLAGGIGSRLRKVVRDIPKSMAAINGRPFLEYLLEFLLDQGITRVILSVGYKREAIVDHFGNRFKKLELDYAVEEEPLGTGGGIRLAFWQIKSERAFVLNGDSIFRFDLPKMWDRHIKKHADATIALRKIPDTSRYGRVNVGRNGRITCFEEKKEGSGPGYINAGIYIIEKDFLMEPWYRGRFSIEKDCFEKATESALIFGFPARGYFRDIGIPEDYMKAQNEFKKLDQHT